MAKSKISKIYLCINAIGKLTLCVNYELNGSLRLHSYSIYRSEPINSFEYIDRMNEFVSEMFSNIIGMECDKQEFIKIISSIEDTIKNDIWNIHEQAIIENPEFMI